MHWLIHRAIGLKYIFKQSESHKVFQLDWSYWIEKWKPIYVTLSNLNSVVSGKAAAGLGIMPSLRKRPTHEGSKGDSAWLGWSVSLKFELHEYVLVHHWYIPVCTGMYKVLLESLSREKTYWLGVLNEYMVVPKHTNTGLLPTTVQCTCSATSTYQYEQSFYWYILVCTWLTKIFLRILFCDFWQREKILGVKNRYVVVFKT